MSPPLEHSVKRSVFQIDNINYSFIDMKSFFGAFLRNLLYYIFFRALEHEMGIVKTVFDVGEIFKIPYNEHMSVTRRMHSSNGVYSPGESKQLLKHKLQHKFHLFWTYLCGS